MRDPGAQGLEALPSHAVPTGPTDDLSASGVPLHSARTRVDSPTRDALGRFANNRVALVSAGVILIMCGMAVFAPFMHTANPLHQDYTALDQPPSWNHWFGTDGLGSDLYSRLVYGLRVPLAVGIFGACATVTIGSVIGVTAAYYGGLVDAVLSRFTDFMFAFPAFLFALLMVTLFGNALDPVLGQWGRVLLLIVVFAVVSWPGVMRLTRALALQLKQRQFVEAARTAGSSHAKIIRRHLLPNLYGLILVQAGLAAVGFVYAEATLSIFGLGVQYPTPDLGKMVLDGSQVMSLNKSELIFPALFLGVMLLAFSFIGDGIRQAVDPRRR